MPVFSNDMSKRPFSHQGFSKKNSGGFTVIELLIVFAIIGLLAAIIYISLSDARARGRDAKRLAELDGLRKALEAYYNEHGQYPEAINWISLEEDDDSSGPFSQAMVTDFLQAMPRDPRYDPSDPTQEYSYQYSTGNTNGQDYKIHINMERGGYEEEYSEAGGDIEYTGVGGNQPPIAPSSPWADNQLSPATNTPLALTFSAIFQDPDTADTSSNYEIQVADDSDFSDIATDNLWLPGKTPMTTINLGDRSPDITYAGTPLANSTTYYWRLSFWDDADTQGAWSATQEFGTEGGANQAPTGPTTLYVDYPSAQSGTANPTDFTHTEPFFSAIYNDPDVGDIATYYRVQVALNSDPYSNSLWNSGKQPLSPNCNEGTRCNDIAYGGSIPLAYGQTYKWRIRYWDDDGTVGAWSANGIITMAANSIPSAPQSPWCEDSASPASDINLTPYFSAVYDDNNSEDVARYYEIQVANDSNFDGGTTYFWQSGKTSIAPLDEGNRSSNITYAGSALSYETTYYWRIRFWDNADAQGQWSTIQQFTTKSVSINTGWYSPLEAITGVTTWHSASNVIDDATIGNRVWSSPGNAITSDDNYAVANNLTSSNESHYLWTDGFNFSIPAGSIVDGVEVKIERYKSGSGTIITNKVRLVNSFGVISGSSVTSYSPWGTSDSEQTLGGPEYKWGLNPGDYTFTADGANDPDFGVVVGARGLNSTPGNAHVDRIQMRLHYTVVPGGLSDDDTIGDNKPWSVPNNAAVSDNQYTSVSGLLSSGQDESHYLRAENFGFNIPSGATIDGIEVKVERSKVGSGAIITNKMRLLWHGVIGGTSLTSYSQWGTSDSEQIFGDPTDLWSRTWTPVDINRDDFGVVFGAKEIFDSSTGAYVDRVQIRVWYIE